MESKKGFRSKRSKVVLGGILLFVLLAGVVMALQPTKEDYARGREEAKLYAMTIRGIQEAEWQSLPTRQQEAYMNEALGILGHSRGIRDICR